MWFIELHFRDANPVGVNVTTKHGSVGEFVVGLCWTLHPVVGERPFKGAGVDIFVWMHDRVLRSLW